MDYCNQCRSFLVKCPCCDMCFCPDCGATEDDLEEMEDEE